ncbi:hypothetical protein D3C76_1646640 [compost metagenome]
MEVKKWQTFHQQSQLAGSVLGQDGLLSVRAEKHVQDLHDHLAINALMHHYVHQKLEYG